MRLVARLAACLAALLAAPLTLAAECGPVLPRAQVEALAADLGRAIGAISLYNGSLRRLGLEQVSYVVRDATVLHERVGRVALLAEVRDTMRHDGERLFVQFKLSHEAALLKQVAAAAHASLERLGPELGGLRVAIGRTKSLFAMCDSPL